MKQMIQKILRRIAVRRNVIVGERFHVGPGSIIWAPRSLSIGDDVYIGKNVTIEVDGHIGDGVLFGNLSGVVGRTDHEIHETGSTIRRSAWVGHDPDRLSRPVRIGSDVWVGYGAVILSGVVVGDSAIIGAGAVVTRNVPANAIMVGNPARSIGSRFTEDDLLDHWASLKRRGVRLDGDTR